MPFLRIVLPLFIRLYIYSRYRIEVHNRDALSDLPRPVIFVSNHNHVIDSLIYKCILGSKFYVCGAAETYFSSPMKRFIMQLGRVIKFSSGEKFLSECLSLLSRGKCVLLYPEMSTRKEMKKFEIHGARVAFHSKVPIVPMRIRGTEQKNRIVNIYFGQPIVNHGCESEEQLNLLLFTSIKSL
jgi:1-acyl-sn-glycerol-3-phosphate acyltransferase